IFLLSKRRSFEQFTRPVQMQVQCWSLQPTSGERMRCCGDQRRCFHSALGMIVLPRIYLPQLPPTNHVLCSRCQESVWTSILRKIYTNLHEQPVTSHRKCWLAGWDSARCAN